MSYLECTVRYGIAGNTFNWSSAPASAQPLTDFTTGNFTIPGSPPDAPWALIPQDTVGTDLTAAMIATNTVVTVTSTAGFSVGDKCVIELDSDVWFWSRVASTGPSTVTLNDGIPSSAAIGNRLASVTQLEGSTAFTLATDFKAVKAGEIQARSVELEESFISSIAHKEFQLSNDNLADIGGFLASGKDPSKFTLETFDGLGHTFTDYDDLNNLADLLGEGHSDIVTGQATLITSVIEAANSQAAMDAIVDSRVAPTPTGSGTLQPFVQYRDDTRAWVDLAGINVGTGTVDDNQTSIFDVNQDATTLLLVRNLNAGTSSRATMQIKSDMAGLNLACHSEVHSVTPDTVLMGAFQNGGGLDINTEGDMRLNIPDGFLGVDVGDSTGKVIDLSSDGLVPAGISSNIYLSNASPEGVITGDGGDITIVDSGATSNMYFKQSDGSSADWKKVITEGNRIEYKGFSLAEIGASGEKYYAGFYESPTTSVVLTIGGTVTQVLGDVNVGYGAHAFCVASGAGGTDLVLTVSGTSIDDSGTRTTSDSEIIVADTDVAITDQYFETTKKWLGQITYTLTGAAGAFTFNYGFAKYEDYGSRAFIVTDFECVLTANANDALFDIELIHHTNTGWTYAATGFIPGTTPVVQMSTDYSTDRQLMNGEKFSYKRSALNEAVDGLSLEGVIVRVTTSTNNAVLHGDIQIGVSL